MLMRAHDGRIDHGVFVIGVLGQTLEYLLPDSAHRPSTESGMNHSKVSKTFRQVTPWYSCSKPVLNRFHKKPIVCRWTPYAAFATR